MTGRGGGQDRIPPEKRKLESDAASNKDVSRRNKAFKASPPKSSHPVPSRPEYDAGREYYPTLEDDAVELIEQLEEKLSKAQERVKQLEAQLEAKNQIPEENEDESNVSGIKLFNNLEKATAAVKKWAFSGSVRDEAEREDVLEMMDEGCPEETVAVPSYRPRANEPFVFKNPLSFPRLLIDATPEKTVKGKDASEPIKLFMANSICEGIMKTAFDMIPTDESKEAVDSCYFGVQPLNKVYVIQPYLEKVLTTLDHDFVTLDKDDLITDGPGGAPGAPIVGRKLTGDVAIHITLFHKCVSLVCSQYEAIHAAVLAIEKKKKANEEKEKTKKKLSDEDLKPPVEEKRLKPLMDAVRKTMVNGLWPEFFHAVISTKGMWARKFHMDRIMALRVCLEAVVQKAIVKKNPRTTPEFLEQIQALFRKWIVANFATFCSNQFKSKMSRAVQYGYKLAFGKEPSQDEIKTSVVLKIRKRITDKKGFPDGCTSFLINKAQLHLAKIGDVEGRKAFDAALVKPRSTNYLTETQLQRLNQPKPQERVAKKKAQLDLSEDELNDEEEDEEEEEEDELEATEHKSRKVAADTTPTTTKDGRGERKARASKRRFTRSSKNKPASPSSSSSSDDRAGAKQRKVDKILEEEDKAEEMEQKASKSKRKKQVTVNAPIKPSPSSGSLIRKPPIKSSPLPSGSSLQNQPIPALPLRVSSMQMAEIQESPGTSSPTLSVGNYFETIEKIYSTDEDDKEDKNQEEEEKDANVKGDIEEEEAEADEESDDNEDKNQEEEKRDSNVKGDIEEEKEDEEDEESDESSCEECKLEEGEKERKIFKERGSTEESSDSSEESSDSAKMKRGKEASLVEEENIEEENVESSDDGKKSEENEEKGKVEKKKEKKNENEEEKKEEEKGGKGKKKATTAKGASEEGGRKTKTKEESSKGRKESSSDSSRTTPDDSSAGESSDEKKDREENIDSFDDGKKSEEKEEKGKVEKKEKGKVEKKEKGKVEKKKEKKNENEETKEKEKGGKGKKKVTTAKGASEEEVGEEPFDVGDDSSTVEEKRDVVGNKKAP